MTREEFDALFERLLRDRDPAPSAGSKLLPGLVGRGVLLDRARQRGCGWLEPGEALDGPGLLACAEAQQSALRPGDILLIRTGQPARRRTMGA